MSDFDIYIYRRKDYPIWVCITVFGGISYTINAIKINLMTRKSFPHLIFLELPIRNSFSRPAKQLGCHFANISE